MGYRVPDYWKNSGRCWGRLTLHAAVSVEDEIVVLDSHKLTAANLAGVDRLMERASVRADRGDLQKAASLYRQVVTLNPSHLDARYRLAVVLLRSRNTRDGLDTLMEILKIHPTDARALAILGK